MEDFIGLIVLLLFWFLSAASKSKKKQVKRESTQSDAQNPVLREEMRMQVKAEQTEQHSSHRAEVCSAERLHLHDVTPLELDEAGEGEDPCHQGSFDLASDNETQEAEGVTASNDERMEDLMRGMIFSEILTRPSERRMMKRNRRGA